MRFVGIGEAVAMARKALYLGSSSSAFGSLPAQTSNGVSIDIFATFTVDGALQELLKSEYEWLILDRPTDTGAVKTLLRTAEITGNGTPTVWMNSEKIRKTGELDSLVDHTFESGASLHLRVTEGRDDQGSIRPTPHPILSTLKREDGDRLLAHIDRDGCYQWVNESFMSSVEPSTDDVIGQPVGDTPPPGTNGDELGAVIQRVIDSGELEWIGTDTASSNGIYCLLPIDDHRLLLFSYSTEGTIAFGEQYLDQLNDLFFIVDFDGNLYYWNDRVNEVTGLSDVELLDINALELFDPEVSETIKEKLQAVAIEGEQTAELPLVTHSGETIPYQFSGSLVTDKRGNPQYVCGIGRDISERVEMRHEIEEAVEKLEESNAELERFASVASHDLREPLRAVRSYLELLDQRYADELDDDAREFIEFAVNGADRMQSMIEDLLEYSRIGSTICQERVDCDEVVDEVSENLAVSIEESNASIYRDTLPAVVADRTMLVQLFQNLIDNAIQHTEAERPEIHLSAKRRNGGWEFAVADNGPGIPDEDLERVFEMFSTQDDENGLGIGLATCRKIVETLGGTIWAESTEGNGSTFYFTLPEADNNPATTITDSS